MDTGEFLAYTLSYLINCFIIYLIIKTVLDKSNISEALSGIRNELSRFNNKGKQDNIDDDDEDGDWDMFFKQCAEIISHQH